MSERGHIPHEKTPLSLPNETRLLALIWIIIGNMTDLRTASKCPESNRHSARWHLVSGRISLFKYSINIYLDSSMWPGVQWWKIQKSLIKQDTFISPRSTIDFKTFSEPFFVAFMHWMIFPKLNHFKSFLHLRHHWIWPKLGGVHKYSLCE